MTAIATAAGIDFSRQPLGEVGSDYFGWQEGQCARAGDIRQGWTARFGLLNPAMVKTLGVEGKVYAGSFAILPEKLESVSTRRRFKDFSLYPTALRDLGLVVDATVPSDEVRKKLLKTARAVVGNAFEVE